MIITLKGGFQVLGALFTMGTRRQRRGWPRWLTLVAFPMGLLNGYLLSLWQYRRREQREPVS